MDKEELCEKLATIEALAWSYDRETKFFGFCRDSFRKIMREAVRAIRENTKGDVNAKDVL